MRCSNCLYDNRPGVSYCEHCGSPLPVEVPLFNTCQECGFLNPPDEKYCERCGIELEISSQNTPAQVRRKKARKRRPPQTDARSFPIFALLFAIFIGLIVVGAMPSNNELAPVLSNGSTTLIALQGFPEDGNVLVAAAEKFTATGMDETGIVRMELYSDGQLAAAQAYDGTVTSAIYTPALDALPEGQHDVFIRSINSDGEASQTEIIPVLSSGVAGGLSIDANPLNLSEPDGLVAAVSDKGDEVIVSWDSPDESVASVKVYCRPPGSPGLVQVGEVDSANLSFSFPFSASGYWDVFVSYCDANHQEGPLGHTNLFILQSGTVSQKNATGSTLPAPEKLHIAATNADCQLVASELGSIRDALYKSCQSMVSKEEYQFLLWHWPPKQTTDTRYTNDDLVGYELKLVLLDSNGQTLGESITALPFAEARGMARSSYDVDCGVKQTWYLRAVGQGTASKWVYAGVIPAKPCEQSQYATDGCSGQMDFQTSWGPYGDFVPDIAFASACTTHDRCYKQSQSGKTKVTCDNEFLADMLEICADSTALIDPSDCSDIASSYYDSVNLYGRYTYQGSFDVMDCLNAVEPGNCFTGSSPQFAVDIYNRMRTGVFWTREAVETGAEKIWHGMEWLAGQIWFGIDRLLHN